MAQSRLEKIGTIFTRVTGLLRSGAMKQEDTPLWYNVYKAFPPKLEPKFDRPAPNIPIRKIFYEEDVIRAKYHKQSKNYETINLSDSSRLTNSQQLISIHNNLRKQGALDDEQIFETAQTLLKEQIQKDAPNPLGENQEENKSPGLVSSFSEAKSSPSVNVRDIFKE